MKGLKLVEVEWEDTLTRTGWEAQEVHENAGTMSCKSVGYLLRRDKDSLSMAATIAPSDGTALASITIPAGCIKRVRYVYVQKKR